jgi:hypothetical protein
MINSIIQIILSIFLIAIMALISYSVYNKEIISGIKFTNTTKKITKIFDGIFTFGDIRIEQETHNKSDMFYIDINPSINQDGGAEYSYNFWLYFNLHVNDNTIIQKSDYDADTRIYYKYGYINLFYKGEPATLPIKSNKYECNGNDIPVLKKLDKNVLIKNPLVKIRNDAKEIIIEYNNINFPETYNSAAYALSCNDNDINTIKNRNINKFGIKDIDTSINKKRYNMITIVFQENPKNENILNSNKANCKVYFNGSLVADRVANINSIEDDTINEFKSRVMKSNFSKLRINDYTLNNSAGVKVSKITDQDNVLNSDPLKMADLSYYNYALNQMEITSLYKAGFNKYDASIIKINSEDDKYIKGSNGSNELPKPI